MQDVGLVIYNSLWKEVATLVNENLQAGIYEVNFEASNYSSGVYFYKLVVDGNVVDPKRMVLLKVLVDEEQNAGTYEVDFDGSNYSSGVYFYKLVVGESNPLIVDGNIIDTKRMVLLK